MKKILKPFQHTGAMFLARSPHALLADEMGLGKTVTALAAAERVGARSVLVICPASVRGGWRQEAAECGVSFPVLHVISYHGASSAAIRRDLLHHYDVVIMDEAHFLKSTDSTRSAAVLGTERGLVRRGKYKWALTGTPVLNRPVELYPLLRVLNGKALGKYESYERFTQRYCGAYWDGYAVNVKGASHLDELAGVLRGFMLRRTKAEVLPELPAKIVSRPPLELTERELAAIYAVEEGITDREAYLSPIHEQYSQLGDLARLLRATGLAKVRALSQFVDDILRTTDKAVVFARHLDVIEQLYQLVRGPGHSVVYKGGMSDADKAAAVRRFMTDPECRVFIGQIQAAGTGINGLQSVCSNVVFAELTWVPGEMAQAVDRCHRIGQTADCVNVYFPHVPGTLESAMLQVHTAKNAVISRVVGV